MGADELAGFEAKFRELAARADVVTMSGSLPRGVDAGYYAMLTGIAAGAGAKVLLDTSGASLEAALGAKRKPYLVKPNLSELGALLGRELSAGDLGEVRCRQRGRAATCSWAPPAPSPSAAAAPGAPARRASSA